jgi:hypothetical protein
MLGDRGQKLLVRLLRKTVILMSAGGQCTEEVFGYRRESEKKLEKADIAEGNTFLPPLVRIGSAFEDARKPKETLLERSKV